MRKSKAIPAMLAATIIWSVAGPVIKLTLHSLPPFTFLALRFLIASIFITPLLAAGGGIKEIKKEGIIRLALLALLGQSISLTFTFFGFKYTSALEGSIIGAVFPIMLTFAGAMFLNENVTRNEKKAIVLTVIGTLLIIFAQPLADKSKSLSINNLLGNILIFAGNSAWLLYVLLEKKRFLNIKGIQKKKYHFEGMAFSFIVAFVSFIPLSIIEINNHPQVIENIFSNKEALLGVFYMGVFSSIVAYLAYDYGLSLIEASETGIYSYLQPLFTIPAAFLLLGEKPSLYLLPGGVLIVIGFITSEANRKKITL